MDYLKHITIYIYILLSSVRSIKNIRMFVPNFMIEPLILFGWTMVIMVIIILDAVELHSKPNKQNIQMNTKAENEWTNDQESEKTAELTSRRSNGESNSHRQERN